MVRKYTNSSRSFLLLLICSIQACGFQKPGYRILNFQTMSNFSKPSFKERILGGTPYVSSICSAWSLAEEATTSVLCVYQTASSGCNSKSSSRSHCIFSHAAASLAVISFGGGSKASLVYEINSPMLAQRDSPSFSFLCVFRKYALYSISSTM